MNKWIVSLGIRPITHMQAPFSGPVEAGPLLEDPWQRVDSQYRLK